MTNQQTLDRIRKARVDLMRHKTWSRVAGVLACGEVTVTDAVATASTDGWNEKYNPAFVYGLTDPELRFLILHEAWGHKAHRHLFVWRALRDEDAKLANVACDFYVNTALVDADRCEGFIALPKVGVPHKAEYRGWSVKMIFDDLKANGNDAGQGDMDEHDWENADDGPTDQRAKEIDRAMRHGEVLHKRMGGGKGDSAGSFGALVQVKVNWREVLREFITATCAGFDEATWKKPNRRFLADDMYMPSMQGVAVGEIVIGFDVSGSCFGSREMTQFVSEIAAIAELMQPEKLHVLYVDWAMQGHQVFEAGQFAVHDLVPRGGGGTDLRVGFDYVKTKGIKPAAMIWLTDGETPYPATAPDYPVLWAMTTRATAPFGTHLRIEV